MNCARPLGNAPLTRHAVEGAKRNKSGNRSVRNPCVRVHIHAIEPRTVNTEEMLKDLLRRALPVVSGQGIFCSRAQLPFVAGRVITPNVNVQILQKYTRNTCMIRHFTIQTEPV